MSVYIVLRMRFTLRFAKQIPDANSGRAGAEA
jgi:hypothetical protein